MSNTNEQKEKTNPFVHFILYLAGVGVDCTHTGIKSFQLEKSKTKHNSWNLKNVVNQSCLHALIPQASFLFGTSMDFRSSRHILSCDKVVAHVVAKVFQLHDMPQGNWIHEDLGVFAGDSTKRSNMRNKELMLPLNKYLSDLSAGTFYPLMIRSIIIKLMLDSILLSGYCSHIFLFFVVTSRTLKP